MHENSKIFKLSIIPKHDEALGVLIIKSTQNSGLTQLLFCIHTKIQYVHKNDITLYKWPYSKLSTNY